MRGVVLVLVGHVFVEARHVSSIPSLVKVPAHHVGYFAQSRGIVGIAAGQGHHAEACGVFLAHHLFQPSGQVEVALHGGLVFLVGGQKNLVHVSPQNDAGVVVVLANHFAQVALAVVTEAGRVGHVVYDGYLLPGQEAEAVAHFEDGVVLRVVRDADEVGTHLLGQQHVAAVHLVAQGGAYRFLVLVPADAAQLVGLSVEEEAFVAVEAEPAEGGVVLLMVEHGVCFAVGQPGDFDCAWKASVSPAFRRRDRLSVCTGWPSGA